MTGFPFKLSGPWDNDAVFPGNWFQDVLKACIAFIFSPNQSRKNYYNLFDSLTLDDGTTVCLQNARNLSVSDTVSNPL
jgi:hypothetical protein